MPHITLAFVKKDISELEYKSDVIADFVNKNIDSGYILDGIQRLNTLKRASGNPKLNYNSPLLLNIIISPNKDMLLYRMITLNNGQKPMTARHQIEILTQELFNFEDYSMDVQTEKERSEKIKRGAFNLGDISKGYLAFLTGNVHNENNKIIDEKMDQILVGRILDSNLEDVNVEFTEVLDLIDRLSKDESIKQWLMVNNNLIGFCVGVKSYYQQLKNVELNVFKQQIEKFESAFKGVNPSKVNLGKIRRDLSFYFITHFNDIIEENVDGLIERFAEVTL
ncbi:hypothetical protein DYU05_11390 [Mucilaginibacter terrenus]|uniref:DUF262 domain-containing protein n=2 Tax=Mucilaginibacter terrenus TaxID=2482727 RepID=A0A3E2NRE7_9SPHI|nr:hypothetical protein DYU05_11390 [Mucilaginibacter terrenus]